MSCRLRKQPFSLAGLLACTKFVQHFGQSNIKFNRTLAKRSWIEKYDKW